MRGPGEGLRENPALDRGGREKGATPWPMAGPRGQDCHAAPAPPPQPTRATARGPKGPPHSQVSHPLVGAVPMMSQRHPFPVSRLSLADETPCVAAQVTGAMALRAPRVRISLPTQSTPG